MIYPSITILSFFCALHFVVSDNVQTNQILNKVMTSSFVPAPTKGLLAAGKGLYDGAETYYKTGDSSQAMNASLNSVTNSASQIVHSVPGAGLVEATYDVSKSVYNGEDVQSAVAKRGEKILNESSLGNTYQLAKDVKNGESVQSVIAKSAKNAAREYAGNAAHFENAMSIAKSFQNDSEMVKTDESSEGIQEFIPKSIDDLPEKTLGSENDNKTDAILQNVHEINDESGKERCPIRKRINSAFKKVGNFIQSVGSRIKFDV